jgi:hypothetical protein
MNPANRSMRIALPQSPNMTANRNGNVMIVSTAGLTCEVRETNLTGVESS